ncbi:hypothetical protein Poli38472_007216 [Pythium oligandrum]|uniref:Uncharacterized protein n=1 Tax=Pythium oligandrum TaxID=41045 RepID=A0A8K1FE58_PYTOL|nr:hypothetical protein Poli38472_007216 [Pythium oligandrum]|eukprot:TMW59071.1 hypothetical protein Poli38472_007216 [Pythium oligandrum]
MIMTSRVTGRPSSASPRASCVLRSPTQTLSVDGFEVLPRDIAKFRIEAIELHEHHMDKQLAIDKLDRLYTACAPTLRTLHLEDCVLSDRVLSFTAERLAQLNVRLEHLVLRRCRQLSMTALLAVSTLCTSTLVTLELSSCHLARQAGIILGQSLQCCHDLRRVVLADNNLRDGGLRAVVDALRVAKQLDGAEGACSVLEELDIARNGVTSTGFNSLATLRIVSLIASGNGVTSVGSILLSNKRLECLELARNPLSEDGLRELVTLLCRSEGSRLRELNIQQCDVSVSGEAFLLQMLVQNKHNVKLEQLLVGERPRLDELADTDDEEDSHDTLDLARQRFQELKTTIERHIPKLTVHVLPIGTPSISDDDDPTDTEDASSETKSEMTVGPENLLTMDQQPTPGRLIRRELLERKEFLRRHSEELPLADDDDLDSGETADNTPVKPPRPHSSGSSSRPASSRAPTVLTHRRSEASLVDEDEAMDPNNMSRRSSSFANNLNMASSSSAALTRTLTANSSFGLPMHPSLDDVASQFSIDPPSSIGGGASSLLPVDVEYIVSRTIETLNRNFEQKLAQLLMRMEFQQQEKNTTQLQSLVAKVEACERAIPRLEARLDVLADRIATSSAHVVKMQSELQTQLQQIKQDAAMKTTSASSSISPSTPLSVMMQNQVDDMVSTRVRNSEQLLQSEFARLRRESTSTSSNGGTPQSIVDAVSVHLTQFKREFDANQSTVLRQFTENIVKDSLRVEDRLQQMEGKVAHLEGVIQAEQQASLLALEAISEAFTTAPGSVAHPSSMSRR